MDMKSNVGKIKIKKWEIVLFVILLLLCLALRTWWIIVASVVTAVIILSKEIEAAEDEELRKQGIDPAMHRAKERWKKWEKLEGQSVDRRKARAARGEVTAVKIDTRAMSGTFAASDSSGRYFTNLRSCTCPDFKKRRLPCKHMYYLAEKCGLMEDGNYDSYLDKAVNYPDYEKDSDQKIQTFRDSRDIAEKMLGNKIIKIILEAGGELKQVDIKKYLDERELQLFDYSVSLLEESGKIQRTKEGNRVVFKIK